MKNLEKVIYILKDQNITVSIAESCSGGYASYLLTRIPGSSKVFKGGFILYSLDSKNKLLKIPKKTLKETRGVSKEIAIILAKKVKKKFSSDIGLSIVGFAGPEANKNIKKGTTFIALADKKYFIAKKMIIKGTRDQVRKKVSLYLIDLLYSHITAHTK